MLISEIKSVVQDWGKPGDIEKLELKWHIPSGEENKFATELLELFLVGELNKLKGHREGTCTMDR